MVEATQFLDGYSTYPFTKQPTNHNEMVPKNDYFNEMNQSKTI